MLKLILLSRERMSWYGTQSLDAMRRSAPSATALAVEERSTICVPTRVDHLSAQLQAMRHRSRMSQCEFIGYLLCSHPVRPPTTPMHLTVHGHTQTSV